MRASRRRSPPGSPSPRSRGLAVEASWSAFDAARRRPLAVDCFVAVPGKGYERRPVAPLEPYVVDFGTGQQTFLVGPGRAPCPA